MSGAAAPPWARRGLAIDLEWKERRTGTSRRPKSERFRAIVLLITAAAVVVGPLALYPSATAEDTVRDLGTLPDHKYSEARRINEAGQVVGWSRPDTSSGDSRAVLWEDETITDLGDLGGSSAQAYDINEAGQIVGSSLNESNYMRAFLWDEGVMIDIDVGSHWAEAWAINDAGDIAGHRLIPDPDRGFAYHAFLLQDGVVTDLGTLPGHTYSFATGLNDAGQVAGYAVDPEIHGSERAFLWEDGVMTDLGALPDDFLSGAADINEAGQIVGWSGGYELGPHAFLWEDGLMETLAPYDNDAEPPFGSHIAYGINDWGQAVGVNGTAVLWEEGTETALGPLAPGRSALARDLNNAGAIVGLASTADYEYHAVLWTKPVPIHDVAVTARAENPYPIVGETIRVTARPENHGNRGETFEVTVEIGPYPVGTQSVTLGARESRDLYFFWDSTGADPGTYPLRATATPVPGETDLADNSFVLEDHVIVLARLEAVPSATQFATDVGLEVAFACDPVDRAAPRGPYGFSWDFGDGATETGDRVTHSYNSSGTKTVTCTVTEENGESASSSVTVQVYPRPSLNVTADRTEASPGTPITFTATATGGSGVYTFDWGFGDGDSASGATVTHAYEEEGRYTVIVIVQDSFGGTAPNTVTIEVEVRDVDATTASSGSGLFDDPLWLAGAIIVAIAAVVGAAASIRRRKRVPR